MFISYSRTNNTCDECFRESHKGHNHSGKHKWKILFDLATKVLIVLLLIPAVFSDDCINGVCYECDGALVERNGEIACLNCNEGFELIDGECKIMPQQLPPSELDRVLYKYFPSNPFLGFLMAIAIILIVIYIFRNWEKIKRRIKNARS